MASSAKNYKYIVIWSRVITSSVFVCKANSISLIKRENNIGHIISLWNNPISDLKKSDKQYRCLTHYLTDEYIDLRNRIIFPTTPYLNNLYHRTCLYTVSNAGFKSMKAQYSLCFSFRYISITFWRTNIASTVQ